MHLWNLPIKIYIHANCISKLNLKANSKLLRSVLKSQKYRPAAVFLKKPTIMSWEVLDPNSSKITKNTKGKTKHIGREVIHCFFLVTFEHVILQFTHITKLNEREREERLNNAGLHLHNQEILINIETGINKHEC